MSVQENAKNVDTWVRGLFILIFGVIFYFLYIIIWLLVIFQFLTKVITGNLNENLSNLSVGLTRFASQVLLYITFQSEERPFPFSPWPKEGASTDTALPESADAGQSEQTTKTKKKKDPESE